MRPAHLLATIAVAAVTLAATVTTGQQRLTLTSSNQPGGPTATQLANQIIDDATGIVLANTPLPDFGIKIGIGNTSPSNLKSCGTFTGAPSPADAVLPTNNPSGDAE